MFLIPSSWRIQWSYCGSWVIMWFGEGNGNLLQYSCLENPMDRGAWETTVYASQELDMTEWLSTHIQSSYQASRMALMVKNSPANAGDKRNTGSIPGLGRSPEGGIVTHTIILARRIPKADEPGGLQTTALQKSTGLKWLSTHTCNAPHSSTLAWKITWMEEPGRLQFMGR